MRAGKDIATDEAGKPSGYICLSMPEGSAIAEKDTSVQYYI